jgi:hypothetical protein
MDAYVLVQTDPKTAPIAGVLRAIPGVRLAEDLRGPYDALALAGSDGSGSALQRIVAEIRNLPGVIRALAAPLEMRSSRVRGARGRVSKEE